MLFTTFALLFSSAITVFATPIPQADPTSAPGTTTAAVTSFVAPVTSQFVTASTKAITFLPFLGKRATSSAAAEATATAAAAPANLNEQLTQLLQGIQGLQKTLQQLVGADANQNDANATATAAVSIAARQETGVGATKGVGSDATKGVGSDATKGVGADATKEVGAGATKEVVADATKEIGVAQQTGTAKKL